MRALALVLVMLVSPLSQAAPIPPPKAKPRPDFSGSWVAVWSGAEWPTVMLPDGTYVAERPGGPRYEGRWELDANNKLIIEERLVNAYGYGQVYRYTFTMKQGKLLSTCGGLRLTNVR